MSKLTLKNTLKKGPVEFTVGWGEVLSGSVSVEAGGNVVLGSFPGSLQLTGKTDADGRHLRTTPVTVEMEATDVTAEVVELNSGVREFKLNVSAGTELGKVLIRNTWRDAVEIDAVANTPFFSGHVVIDPEKSVTIETSPKITVDAVVEGVTVPPLTLESENEVIFLTTAANGGVYLKSE